MDKMYKITPALCKKCNYGIKSNGTCDYISIVGHSRTFDSKGKQRLPKGYCDKYLLGEKIRGQNWK